jgi:hypothetical protein
MASLRYGALLLLVAALGCDDTSRNGNDLGTGDLSLVNEDLSVPGPATKCMSLNAPKLLSSFPGSHRFPRLGFTGGKFVAAWNTEVVEASVVKHRIDFTLTDVDGNTLGPNVSLSRMPIADFWAPSVTPLLGGTVVAWTRLTPNGANVDSDIVIDTLDPNGQKLDLAGNVCDPGNDACGVFKVTNSGTASYPYLARPNIDRTSGMPTDNQVGLTFVDSRNHPCTPGPPCLDLNDVYWKSLQSNGTVLIDDRQVTVPGANGRNAFPRLAFDGVHDGLVWRDDSAGTTTSFLFATLDSNGQISTPPAKIGAASGSYVSAGAPDLVWTGQEYALATATGSDTLASVVFQRFQSNGVSSLSPVGVTFGGVSCTPAIAWDGQFYAVAWQTNCGQPGSDLAFELVDAQGIRQKPDGTSCGASLDPNCGVTVLTHNTTAIAAFPELSWAGGHAFGLTWMSTDTGDGGTAESEVYFTRVECVSP